MSSARPAAGHSRKSRSARSNAAPRGAEAIESGLLGDDDVARANAGKPIPPRPISPLLRGRGAVDEGGGGESSEQRKSECDIPDPARACGRSDQEERTDSPGSDELRRHHAIGVARAAQDAYEPDSHREEDWARRRKKKISHR
jgi:hypothetical protein